ncbi:MAG TPA: TauD/TfdA family dioxygenase [Acidimicrobiales bacterium]|nr:TauD/TfdA family dioxygenase [Acidimicrobiales bacterium]
MNCFQVLRRFSACGVELGSELSLVALMAEAPDSLRRELWNHLDESFVVFLPEQALSVDDLAAFVHLMGGAVCETPFLEAIAEHPGFVRVVRTPQESGLMPFGWGWHSDWSFLPNPPPFSLLYSVAVPATGGDTLWSNQVLAFERLSSGLREVLRGLKGVHSARASYGIEGSYSEGGDKRAMQIMTGEQAHDETMHPAVLQLPDGREALYLNESYTVGFGGWREREATGLLQFLFRWQALDDFSCRYTWAPNTIALWDNRPLIHRALDDCRGSYREFVRATFSVIA